MWSACTQDVENHLFGFLLILSLHAVKTPKKGGGWEDPQNSQKARDESLEAQTLPDWSEPTAAEPGPQP